MTGLMLIGVGVFFFGCLWLLGLVVFICMAIRYVVSGEIILEKSWTTVVVFVGYGVLAFIAYHVLLQGWLWAVPGAQ